jgi:hypothetical protein
MNAVAKRLIHFWLNLAALWVFAIMLNALMTVDWKWNLLYDLLYARAQSWAFVSDHAASLLVFCIAPIFLMLREREFAPSVFMVFGISALKELMNIVMLVPFGQSALAVSIFWGNALGLKWGLDLLVLISFAFAFTHPWQRRLMLTVILFLTAVLSVTYVFIYICPIPVFASTIVPDNPNIGSQYYMAFWNNLIEVGFWVASLGFAFTPKRWWR